MSELRAAVFVAKPIPFKGQGLFNGEGLVGHWSPISCTLVYDKTSALLVDAPIDIENSKELVAWIQKIAPGRVLETIYITHGHPDHWFGVPIVLEKFPNAKILGTPGTIAHAKENVEPGYYSAVWGAWFDDVIPKERRWVFPEPLPEGNKFYIGGKWECEAIEVGHSDTCNTTILWIPALKLVVAGDVIYGQVHAMFAIATTKAQRDEWLRAVDMVESLKPAYVIAGHQQAEEIHGNWNIATTRAYIKDFERLLGEVKARGGTSDDFYDEMMKLHGDRANPMVLRWGVKSNL
ncbi:hypothetical protein CKM354_000403000 [Cercospora kikuchii]|uniref:Metallo-beta-lactamase domain-containing protein n=1 Tax=Cercospora kikuchii TaxID=84275 RepID=A0A9P3CG21_9PEZI|nr:uncharacterized protein CKM354_000403000 [Cercospora kikuchii]GIZ40702.1 hypothetical protein CKM354_000403000 [Cercospora kikuchii]